MLFWGTRVVCQKAYRIWYHTRFVVSAPPLEIRCIYIYTNKPPNMYEVTQVDACLALSFWLGLAERFLIFFCVCGELRWNRTDAGVDEAVAAAKARRKVSWLAR